MTSVYRLRSEYGSLIAVGRFELDADALRYFERKFPATFEDGRVERVDDSSRHFAGDHTLCNPSLNCEEMKSCGS